MYNNSCKMLDSLYIWFQTCVQNFFLNNISAQVTIMSSSDMIKLLMMRNGKGFIHELVSVWNKTKILGWFDTNDYQITMTLESHSFSIRNFMIHYYLSMLDQIILELNPV